VRAAIEADLAAVRAAGAVDEALVRDLVAMASADDPGVARTGVIHTDLCPENLVVDRTGALRAIDNEAIRMGPTALDLARVWYRWPMAADEWRTFVGAYARLVDPTSALAHFAFWKVAAVARSARIRVTQGTDGADVPLRRLALLVR
jgi:Ser/Thr protein kinase RdoA (MazF antagonist)